MDSLLDQFSRSLQTGIEIETPFRHWLLERVLPDEICAAIRALPFAPPAIADTAGKRETHNSTRTFFSVENRRRFAVCQELAETLQNPAASNGSKLAAPPGWAAAFCASSIAKT